jgi:hypothetical protein
VRIRVSETVTSPFISRELDGTVILSINTQLNFEEIESAIGDQFAQGERDLAYLLWTDDETQRIFTQVDGTTDFFIDFRSDK